MMPARFQGWIAGIGTAAGLRCVVGHWQTSALGAFTDVMVEQPDGLRVLLAPSDEVAAFVAATYRFDQVRTVPVTVGRAGGRWTVEAGPLGLTFDVGRRPPLGYLLRAVPHRVATNTAWITSVD